MKLSINRETVYRRYIDDCNQMISALQKEVEQYEKGALPSGDVFGIMAALSKSAGAALLVTDYEVGE